MIPQVYHAIWKFENEVKSHYPEVRLELIEPLAGADASFLVTFPTPSWFDGLHRLTALTLDIEEETNVWISLLPEGTEATDASHPKGVD